MALASACVMALLLPTTLSTQSKAEELTPATTTAETTTASAKIEATSTSPITATAPTVSATQAPATTLKLPVSPIVAALASPSKVKAAAPIVPSNSQIHLRAVVAGKSQTANVELSPRATVGEALKAMGIKVGVLDRVSPEAPTLVRDGQTITVQRVSNRLAKKYIAVPAQLMYRPSTAIAAGTQQQIQSPRQGQIEITERIWTLNGKETRREFVSKKLSVTPQPRIIALGARSNVMPENVRPHKRYASARGYINSFRGGSPRDRMMALAPENQSSDASTLRPIRCIEGVLTTGYSAGPAGGSISNWTATGVRCTYGAVAVDPRLIPLGSKLYIEGYGYGFACDTGGAIKGKHIDLAFDSARAAMNHGKSRTRVWILGR